MSTLKLDTIASRDGTESTDVTNVINGSAKAWVNFDGGTPSIRKSFNVGSITDNGTGDFTVNFITAMPDNDYCVSVFSGNDSNATVVRGSTAGASFETSSVRIKTGLGRNSGNEFVDDQVINVVIFR